MAGTVAAEPFALADKPRAWQFPEDHGAHPAYQTEWWYVTGNLTGDAGEAYGYQFTIFRRRLSTDDATSRSSAWAVRDVYLSHCALSDLQTPAYYHDSRLARPAFGLAGATTSGLSARLESSVIEETSGGLWHVRSEGPEFAYELTMVPTRAPLLHGENGLDAKGPGAGQASYYYSMTRLETSGTVVSGKGGKRVRVRGVSWMDHEFGSSQLSAGQTGWDWFCAHLSDGSDLMLYRLRTKDGGTVAESGGTLRRADGKVEHFSAADMEVLGDDVWRSAATKAAYPLRWRLKVGRLGLDVMAEARARNQEMFSPKPPGFGYYEGSAKFSGSLGGQAVEGLGYMELTGYDESLSGRL